MHLTEKARAAAASGDMASEFTALAQKASMEGGTSSPTQILENKAARCFKQAKDFYDAGNFDQADALLKPLLQYVPGFTA